MILVLQKSTPFSILISAYRAAARHACGGSYGESQFVLAGNEDPKPVQLVSNILSDRGARLVGNVQKEYHEHTEHFLSNLSVNVRTERVTHEHRHATTQLTTYGDEPSVARDTAPVLEQFCNQPIRHDSIARRSFNHSPLCAPCTLSTTSSVFASIRWIISLCSETMVASCPKIYTHLCQPNVYERGIMSRHNLQIPTRQSWIRCFQ